MDFFVNWSCIGELFLNFMYFFIGVGAIFLPTILWWFEMTMITAIFYAITWGSYYNAFLEWFIAYTIIIIVVGLVKYNIKKLWAKYSDIKKREEEVKKENFLKKHSEDFSHMLKK